MNTEKFREYYEHLNHNPAKFIQEFYGIKFPFQKVIIDAMYKSKQISYRRNPYYRHQNYMSLCSAYLNMKDDTKIVISSPDGNKVMNKEEFGKWLENEYWRWKLC